MSQQPEALRLAVALEMFATDTNPNNEAAAELRRLHAVEERLHETEHALNNALNIKLQLLEALDDMCAEFRAHDLPYGSQAYRKATAAIAAAKQGHAQEE